MRKVLINASNLHVGGGVQVAASFLNEICETATFLENFELTIYVSSTVCLNIEAKNRGILEAYNFEVFDVYGLEALKPSIEKKFQGFDLVFSIFGPIYLPRKVPNHIVGFAQYWILYPDNEISRQQSFFLRVKTKIKYEAYWFFFKFSAARLVVELPHVKNRLISFKNYPSEKIDVVENCFSALYLQKSTWHPLARIIPQDKKIIKIGYISRAYPHKNIAILLEVARVLSKLSQINFEFYVTLSESEWASFTPDFRAIIKNVGPLTVAQCPSFYQEMNGVIFTSLLECFSATPLEAMVMKKPLFASDREFVRDCCADNAIYVDPMDAKNIAEKIHGWFSSEDEAYKIRHIEKAYQHVLNLPNSRDRALAYINIINQQLNS